VGPSAGYISFESLNRHHLLACNDVLQHLHPLRPEDRENRVTPTNQDIGAATRRSPRTGLAIVENHSKLEVIAAGVRQPPEPLEVTRIRGRARPDFDTDQCTTSRFNLEVNLVLVFASTGSENHGSTRRTRNNCSRMAMYFLVVLSSNPSWPPICVTLVNWPEWWARTCSRRGIWSSFST
jgi:hypothetical protein